MSNAPAMHYNDKDDARHPFEGDKYYEWWYFDAQFDNGYSCVITFHYRLVFMEPHFPALQMHIYAPDGKGYVGFKSYDAQLVSASPDHCDVKMGESHVRQENGVYKVLARTRKAGAELTFRNILPGWKPDGTGSLYDKGGIWQGWVVPVPRGEVEGTLYFGDQAVKVKGNRGYHDHNWGNAAMHDVFSGWYWGRLYDDKYTVIYGWVYPMKAGDPMSAKLYVARENKPILATRNFVLKEKDVQEDPDLKRSYARSLELTSKEKDVDFSCTMNTKNVVEKLDMSGPANWPTYYFRFLADYDARIAAGSRKEEVKGETIHEYMLFK